MTDMALTFYLALFALSNFLLYRVGRKHMEHGGRAFDRSGEMHAETQAMCSQALSILRENHEIRDLVQQVANIHEDSMPDYVMRLAAKAKQIMTRRADA